MVSVGNYAVIILVPFNRSTVRFIQKDIIRLANSIRIIENMQGSVLLVFSFDDTRIKILRMLVSIYYNYETNGITSLHMN